MERDPGISSLRCRGARFDAPFELAGTGQALARLAIGAPGADWSSAERACAVVEVRVDDGTPSHLIVPTTECVRRDVHLGRLSAGEHTLHLGLGRGTAAEVRTLELTSVRVDLIEDGDPLSSVLRHAPILFGRTTPHLGSPWQNAITDAPLVSWYTDARDTRGRRTLEYSVLWTNEDEGTSPAALMARWGRTTDIEWIYRLDVDGGGNPVASTPVFQGPNHRVLPFHGEFEGDRPLLRTGTGNNMVTDRIDAAPMRFSLAPTSRLGPAIAREDVMRRHAWTYDVMRAELQREGRIGEGPGQVVDPRRFLYLGATTVGTGVQDGHAHPGVAFRVRLAGDTTFYRSDLGEEELAVSRLGPISSAACLPPGATSDDVAEISIVAHRAGRGISPVGALGLSYAFMLDDRVRPMRSFAPVARTSPAVVPPSGTTLWRRDTGSARRSA